MQIDAVSGCQIGARAGILLYKFTEKTTVVVDPG